MLRGGDGARRLLLSLWLWRCLELAPSVAAAAAATSVAAPAAVVVGAVAMLGGDEDARLLLLPLSQLRLDLPRSDDCDLLRCLRLCLDLRLRSRLPSSDLLLLLRSSSDRLLLLRWRCDEDSE
jgi:hypothetical protein